MRSIPTSVIAAAWLTAGLGAAIPALAQSMVCPAAHAGSSPGVLKETAAQMQRTGADLASSSDPNRIPDMIHDLRGRYPGVSDGEVENYLVAAYCPEIAKLNGLTPSEQMGRVQLFARQVEVDLHRP